ncbi:MAG: ATP-binding protein [Desulfobulbaceae bacterium]|nr:ATP-binding protein [Desulfobulbaceae bacterium]
MTSVLRFITKRLTIKILLTLTLLTSFIMALLIHLGVTSQREHMRENMAAHGNNLKSTIYAGIKHPMSMGDSGSITNQLADINEMVGETEIVICDFDQRIIFSTHEKNINQQVKTITDNPDTLTAIEKFFHTDPPAPTLYLEETSQGKQYLLTLHSITNEPECHHCHGDSRKILGGLLVRQSTDATYEIISSLRERTILISVIGLTALIGAIYFLLVRLVTDPVTKLAEKAGELAEGNLDVTVPVTSGDVVGRLATSFNSMVHSIKDQIEYANGLRDNIVDPMLLVDTNMIVLYVNEACLKLTGKKKEDIEGKLTCKEVLQSNICSQQCPIEHCLDSGIPIQGTRANICNESGKIIPLMISAGALRDAQGRIIGAVEIFKDISVVLEAERLKYIQKTAAREEEQRKLLENSAQNLLATLSRASKGDLQARAEFLSSGEIMDNLAGSTNSMLENLEKMYDKIAHFNKKLEQEVARRTVMLRERTVLLERANRELRELDKLKSSFLANMSHELRTPMNSIIGYTDLLLDRIDGEINEDQEASLQKVANNAQHLLQLINDILDMSKIEAGKIDLSIKKLDIEELIKSIAETMSPLVNEKGLAVNIDFPDNLPQVYGDEDKIRQIFTNLFSNAVKFTSKGSINVEGVVSESKISSDNQPLFMEIRVRDTGIGIHEKDIKKLFNKFSQVDASTSRQYEGTGLGLSIARGLVTLHKGTIWVESVYGEGTTIYLTLPIREAVLTKPEKAVIDRNIAYNLAGYFNKPVDFFLYESGSSKRPIKCWEYNHCEQTSCPAHGNKDHRCWLISETHCKGTEIITGESKADFCRHCELMENLVIDDYQPQDINEDVTPRSSSDSNKKKLLVIDDNPEVIDLIKKNIGRNYQIIGLLSGKGAVEEAKLINPDAITLDIMMPEINGWEVLQALKKDPLTKEIPVIILSIVDDKKMGFGLGAAEYMVKPLDKNVLLQKLKNLEKISFIKKILIVDEETGHCETVSTLLQHSGYDTTTVADTQHLNDYLKINSPNLIILNLNVPDGSCFDILQQIKNDEHIKNVPLIIITRDNLKKEELNELNGRIQATLNKSLLTPEELLSELKNTIKSI